MQVPPFPIYLFDVDGTLVDSWRDICGAVQETLAFHGRKGVDNTFLRRYIGHHLIDLWRDLGYSDSESEKLTAHYRQVYPKRNHASTFLYPGVKETLAALGGRKATATTKGTPTTRVVLEKFGILGYFDHVQGTDGFPSKPAPDVLLKSIELFGARPEECLMVGDAEPDMEAARRAGVKLCAVRYGYGDPAALQRWEPDFWIDDLRELVAPR
jgi:HAD superfamily hydrolase (TIGR01509 family)